MQAAVLLALLGGPAPVPIINPEAIHIQVLIAQMGDDVFRTRERANRELYKIGKPALPYLLHTLRASSDPEIRHRAAPLVRRIHYTYYSEQIVGLEKMHCRIVCGYTKMTGVVVHSTKDKSYVLTCVFGNNHHDGEPDQANPDEAKIIYDGKEYTATLIKKTEDENEYGLALLSFDKGSLPAAKLSNHSPKDGRTMDSAVYAGCGAGDDPKMKKGWYCGEDEGKRSCFNFEEAEYGDAGGGIFMLEGTELRMFALYWGTSCDGLPCAITVSREIKAFLKGVEYK